MFTPSVSPDTLCGVLQYGTTPRLYYSRSRRVSLQFGRHKVVRAYSLRIRKINIYSANPSTPSRVSTSTCLPSPTWILFAWMCIDSHDLSSPQENSCSESFLLTLARVVTCFYASDMTARVSSMWGIAKPRHTRRLVVKRVILGMSVGCLRSFAFRRFLRKTKRMIKYRGWRMILLSCPKCACGTETMLFGTYYVMFMVRRILPRRPVSS